MSGSILFIIGVASLLTPTTKPLALAKGIEKLLNPLQSYVYQLNNFL
ncbi:hypothetical protein EYB33_12730 [Lysinibacillus sphaericus]|nr:hypothetical protein [Lysinibacillus sphaericus]UDK97109.1 hypothetical protein EYB33_12730 [Lysinibacillus sphaericus]